MSARKRKGVRPTHEWELLLPLFEWPEQEEYEAIRPLVLFDASVAERARGSGCPNLPISPWLRVPGITAGFLR